MFWRRVVLRHHLHRVPLHLRSHLMRHRTLVVNGIHGRSHAIAHSHWVSSRHWLTWRHRLSLWHWLSWRHVIAWSHAWWHEPRRHLSLWHRSLRHRALRHWSLSHRTVSNRCLHCSRWHLPSWYWHIVTRHRRLMTLVNWLIFISVKALHSKF